MAWTVTTHATHPIPRSYARPDNRQNKRPIERAAERAVGRRVGSVPRAFALSVVTVAAWIAVLAVSQGLGTMDLGLGPFVAVWVLMTAAMMLPVLLVSSAPLRTGAHVPTVPYVAGYLLVWSVTALPAYVVMSSVPRWAGRDATTATALAGAIFLTCGVYQLTTAKQRGLARCRGCAGAGPGRTPAGRDARGDLRAGLRHGRACLGCCWALMALLPAFGLMSVVAMIGLTVVVLVERASAHGATVARALGLAAVLLAVAVLDVPGLAPGLTTTPHGTHPGTTDTQPMPGM